MPGCSDEAYQDRILPHVSRTFALTIPQLPPRCAHRSPAPICCAGSPTPSRMSRPCRRMKRWSCCGGSWPCCGREEGAAGARAGAAAVGPTLPAERDLALNLERVVRVTPAWERRSARRFSAAWRSCAAGCTKFQRTASLLGSAALDRPRRLLLLRGRCRGRNADRAVLRLLADDRAAACRTR